MALLSEACVYPSCGQEVRFGWRDGRRGWWHREAADHNPMFGSRCQIVERPADAVDEDAVDTTIPEPEVRATPVERGDPRVPGGAANVMKWATESGWDVAATYSRGPYVGAVSDEVLSISDCVVVRMVLDGGRRRAVASWRDGSLDFIIIGGAETAGNRIVNSEELKTWLGFVSKSKKRQKRSA